jgi:hypothetical protein
MDERSQRTTVRLAVESNDDDISVTVAPNDLKCRYTTHTRARARALTHTPKKLKVSYSKATEFLCVCVICSCQNNFCRVLC